MISNFPSKKEEKAVVDGVVEYEEGITVDELSQKIGQTPANVIKVLFMLGTMVTINSSLDDANFLFNSLRFSSLAAVA